MDLELPITTINGEPIGPLVLALPPLVRAVSDRVSAHVRGDPCPRIVLVPCVRRALLPIWMDLLRSDEGGPTELQPGEALLLLIRALECLVDQVEDAVWHNLRVAA